MQEATQLIDTAEAARLIGVSQRWISKLASEGKLKAETSSGVRGGKSGQSYAISVDDLPKDARVKRVLQQEGIPGHCGGADKRRI